MKVISAGLMTAMAGFVATSPENPAETPTSPAKRATTVSRQICVQPGTLVGRVLRSGTRTPMHDHHMVIRAADDDRLVGQMTTLEHGGYTTLELAPGSYLMEVADGLELGLEVRDDATLETLDLVLPTDAVSAAVVDADDPQDPVRRLRDPLRPPATPGAAGPAVPAPSIPPVPVPAAAPVASGLGTLGWGVVGVGATAAVAVPVAIAASDDDDETVVSPSASRAN